MTGFFEAAHSSPLEGWGQEQDASCVPTGMDLCPPCLCLCLLGEEPGCLCCAGGRLESACKSLLINYCIGVLPTCKFGLGGKKKINQKGKQWWTVSVTPVCARRCSRTACSLCRCLPPESAQFWGSWSRDNHSVSTSRCVAESWSKLHQWV